MQQKWVFNMITFLCMIMIPNTCLWILYNTPKFMQFPPQSPDINPIEHMWEVLDAKVRSRAISNKQDLISALRQEWDAIAPSVTLNLVESMPRRLQAIIHAKGIQQNIRCKIKLETSLIMRGVWILFKPRKAGVVMFNAIHSYITVFSHVNFPCGNKVHPVICIWLVVVHFTFLDFQPQTCF